MWRIAGALLVVAPFACATESDRQPNAARWITTFDSTGDTIVARVAAADPAAVDSRLVLEQRIGHAEGSDSVTFGQILYVAIADDDRVFVYDQQGPTIKLFDSTGTLLRFVGGKGAGPGEFEQVAGMDVLPNGQLTLWDASHARVNRYSRDGDFIAEWRVPVSGFFTSGALRADRSGAIVLHIPVTSAARLLDREHGYVRFDSAGVVRDTVRVPKWIDRPPQITAGRPNQVMVSMSLPLAPNAVDTWGRDGSLISGPSTPYAVYVRHGDGRPLKLEREWSPARALAEERDELRELVTWQIKLSIPDWTWSGPEIPTTKPAYGSLQSGEDGSIWVAVRSEAERLPDEPTSTPSPNSPPPRRYREPNVFDVFSAQGTFLGRVRASDGQWVLRMRGNRAWGVLSDSLGIQYVARWRIDPPLTTAATGRP